MNRRELLQRSSLLIGGTLLGADSLLARNIDWEAMEDDLLGSKGIGDPAALSGHIGEVLIATASGLFIAIPAFMGFYFLRNKLQAGMHNLEEEAERLFRNAPYEYLQDADVGQEETFAAMPNWLESSQGA